MNAATFTELCLRAFNDRWKWRAAVELGVMEIEIDQWLRADRVPDWAAQKIAGHLK